MRRCCLLPKKKTSTDACFHGVYVLSVYLFMCEIDTMDNANMLDHIDHNRKIIHNTHPNKHCERQHIRYCIVCAIMRWIQCLLRVVIIDAWWPNIHAHGQTHAQTKTVEMRTRAWGRQQLLDHTWLELDGLHLTVMRQSGRGALAAPTIQCCMSLIKEHQAMHNSNLPNWSQTSKLLLSFFFIHLTNWKKK